MVPPPLDAGFASITYHTGIRTFRPQAQRIVVRGLLTDLDVGDTWRVAENRFGEREDRGVEPGLA